MKKRKEKGLLVYEFDVRDFENGKGLSTIREIKEKYIKKGIDIQLIDLANGAYRVEIDTKNRNLQDRMYNKERTSWRESQKVPRAFLRKTRTDKNELEGHINSNRISEYGDYTRAKKYQKYINER